VQVAPTDYNVQESVCSLLFASRVRKCEIGKAKKREQSGELSRLRGQAQKHQDKARAQEDEIRQLREELIAERKQKQEATTESEKAKRDIDKAIEKEGKRVEEEMRSKLEEASRRSRNDAQEIESLRKKLQRRDEEDKGNFARLESKYHAVQIEKQQLKNSLQQLVGAQPPDRARTSSITESDSKENAQANVQTPDHKVKKSVHFKNTPLLIPTRLVERERPARKVGRVMAPTASSKQHHYPSNSGRTPSRNKALGSASRVLQTPGRTSVRKPRRVLATDRRPKWN